MTTDVYKLEIEPAASWPLISSVLGAEAAQLIVVEAVGQSVPGGRDTHFERMIGELSGRLGSLAQGSSLAVVAVSAPATPRNRLQAIAMGDDGPWRGLDISDGGAWDRVVTSSWEGSDREVQFAGYAEVVGGDISMFLRGITCLPMAIGLIRDGDGAGTILTALERARPRYRIDLEKFGVRALGHGDLLVRRFGEFDDIEMGFSFIGSTERAGVVAELLR